MLLLILKQVDIKKEVEEDMYQGRSDIISGGTDYF